MDRYAIFVDAGYLFAAAGSLCFGTSKRRDLNLDAEKATRFLRERCGSHCDQAHLRTYWYDGAPDAVPTSDQLQIGGQQGVNLAGRPRIPQSIDVWLLKNAATRFGDPLSEDARHEVRAGFWQGIETATTADRR